ncbi:hypothetical protein ACRRTK_004142 [Alexandromys fortis]
MEFLQRKYEYSQNILVNKEFGWALERAPLTALAVVDSLHPYGNLYTQGTLLQLLVPLLDQASMLFTSDASFCPSSSVNKCKDTNLVFKLY